MVIPGRPGCFMYRGNPPIFPEVRLCMGGVETAPFRHCGKVSGPMLVLWYHCSARLFSYLFFFFLKGVFKRICRRFPSWCGRTCSSWGSFGSFCPQVLQHVVERQLLRQVAVLESQAGGARGPGRGRGQGKVKVPGVDFNSIPFNHRSFQTPVRFP